MSLIHNNLQRENLLKNPFKGGVYMVKETSEHIYYTIVADSIYPPFYLWAIPMFIVTLFFTGLQWSMWYLPSLLLFSTGILYTYVPLYVTLLFGLKKVGYTQELKLLSLSNVIRLMVSIKTD